MHSKPCIKPTPNINYVIYTDIIESGWRAHYGITIIKGLWSDNEIHHHINILQLLAIEFALKAFLKDSSKKHVRIFSDNIIAVTYINKQGGIKSFSSNETNRRIWGFCIHNINIIMVIFQQSIYLASIIFLLNLLQGNSRILLNGCWNQKSLTTQDSSEWMLEPKIFDYSIHQFDRSETDMFASRLTKQIPIYASRLLGRESFFVDAFTINWNNIFIYVFPLFSIIWRVLQKIWEECRKAIVLVPL